MTTDPTLPVEYGTELVVSCTTPGHNNMGASDITCAGGDRFLHSDEEPQCVAQGEYIIYIE